MFTLKLYQNGPLPPNGRTVIMECAGVWVDHGPDNVKHLQAFKRKVGVMDEDGPHDFYIGGNVAETPIDPASNLRNAIDPGLGGNWFGWGVLENAQGKTTEMFR